jgi:DNA-nicking Smr family endonuclease
MFKFSEETMVKSSGNSNGKKPPSSLPDEDLWEHVKQSVKPLKNKDKITPSVRLKSRKSVDAMPHVPMARVQKQLSKPVDTSVDKRTEDRFRKGQMPIEARLDLHGMTVAKAQPQLIRFVLDCRSKRLRCVLVITGKGKTEDGSPGGVLRRSLPEWLRSDVLGDAVLKYTAAKPKDGGGGAFYVLLRRVR